MILKIFTRHYYYYYYYYYYYPQWWGTERTQWSDTQEV